MTSWLTGWLTPYSSNFVCMYVCVCACVYIQEEMNQLLEDRAKLANVMKARPRGKETDTYLPVNLDRLITTARRNERITDRSQSDLDPKEVGK